MWQKITHLKIGIFGDEGFRPVSPPPPLSTPRQKAALALKFVDVRKTYRTTFDRMFFSKIENCHISRNSSHTFGENSKGFTHLLCAGTSTSPTYPLKIYF